MSDRSVDELHEFATKKLGFKRSWFQSTGHQKYWYPHYDCTTKRAKQRAILAGAVEIAPKKLIKIVREAPYQKDNPFKPKLKRGDFYGQAQF